MPMKLIFLPGGGYFFDSSVRTYWTDQLDAFVKSLLTGTASGEKKVSRLLQIELASDCGFVIYQDTDGNYITRHNLDSHYPKLAKWINSDVEHHGDKYSIALGPSGRFFALSNRGYRWYGVPEQFQEEIQTMISGEDDYLDANKVDEKCPGWRRDWKPNGAVFGVSETFIITCEGGKHLALSANLGKHYPDLMKRLKERFRAQQNSESVYIYISINPYEANEFLVVWADESISWNLPPSFASMSGAVREWLAQTGKGQALLATLENEQHDQQGKPPPSPTLSSSPSVSFSRSSSDTASTITAAPSSSTGGSSTLASRTPRPGYASTLSAPASIFPASPSSASSSPGAGYSVPRGRFGQTHVPTAPQPPRPSHPPSYQSRPPSATYSPSQSPLWNKPQDTSITDMLRFFRTMSHQLHGHGGGQGGLGSFINAVSGGGGGGSGSSSFGTPSSVGPMSMFNPGVSYNPMGYGMDPTSAMLGGGDPTGGLFSGGGGGFGGLGGLGGGMFPMDPFSMAGSLGFDPTSMALNAGCSIM